MNKKASKRASRVRYRPRSGNISSTAQGLTSQAGFISVVKYLNRMGFETTIKQSVPHSRGDNADYHLSDTLLLILVGMIGGAPSVAKGSVKLYLFIFLRNSACKIKRRVS